MGNAARCRFGSFRSMIRTARRAGIAKRARHSHDRGHAALRLCPPYRFAWNLVKSFARIDNSTPETLTRPDLTVSSQEERKGNAVRDRSPNSAAAPATVSGELVPQSHWENPGKAVTGADPQARRPAVTSIGCRAGCLGVDLSCRCDAGGAREPSQLEHPV
jgi:hypothetical protein